MKRDILKPRTCVLPEGHFQWGVHRPHFCVTNFRERDAIEALGRIEGGGVHQNQVNFPAGAVTETEADWIFEIPNAFPFRGTTYICKSWADEKAENPSAICLPEMPSVSLRETMNSWPMGDADAEDALQHIVNTLPDPLRIALASTSTDPDDLISLARFCCDFVYDELGKLPVGLQYREDDSGRISASIRDHVLFETLVNNRHLPDIFKEVMVLRPGVQGKSEIVGDWLDEGKGSHIFEYLRRNSYIPWGHYAANMANDSVRYDVHDLSLSDMVGLRHLYYQRTYARLARQFNVEIPSERRALSAAELEILRQGILKQISQSGHEGKWEFTGTLWGWNFGFDFAPSHYRLHASHQQIHQQFSLIPHSVSLQTGDLQNRLSNESMTAYGCGDLIADFSVSYQLENGIGFFESYMQAILTNKRLDGDGKRPSSLIVYEDDEVWLFVPKAQTSQWEIQLMTINPVGNILEAGPEVRQAIDRAMLIAVKVLSTLGARMITTIEYPKRLDSQDRDQRLLYAFMPKLPESPGAFSEAQLRWINGHYPEDFAEACRLQLSKIEVD